MNINTFSPWMLECKKLKLLTYTNHKGNKTGGQGKASFTAGLDMEGSLAQLMILIRSNNVPENGLVLCLPGVDNSLREGSLVWYYSGTKR